MWTCITDTYRFSSCRGALHTAGVCLALQRVQWYRVLCCHMPVMLMLVCVCGCVGDNSLLAPLHTTVPVISMLSLALLSFPQNPPPTSLPCSFAFPQPPSPPSTSSHHSVPYAVKGESIYAYVTVLDEAQPPTAKLHAELINLVKNQIGSFAAPDVIHWAPGECVTSFV